MVKVLIVYYPKGEVSKVSKRMQESFEKKKFKVTIKQIKLKEEMDIRKQFKREKKLELSGMPKSISSYNIIIIGSPIVAFTSVPAVNAFIRSLPKASEKKVILYATGIGLPGKAIKKMSSLLSMKGCKIIGSKVFSSIFEFDERKLKEVDAFIESIKV